MSDLSVVQNSIILPEDYKVFRKPDDYSMSQRKLERYRKIAQIKAYYQRNPVKFIEEILGAKLFDAQAYCVQMSWNRPYVLWVCSRGYGKSSLIDLILMAKGCLYNNYWSYIASGSGDQSILTFKTLENIANQNIESMTGLTNVFKQQVEVKNSGGDGFVHNPSGHFYSLYNGSFTKTLNSNIDKRRGARGNLVVFDECGWLDDEMMQVYAAFTIVNKDLKLGGKVDVSTINTLPKEVKNQLFYISSASSVDTPFFAKYRDFSKQMILGDPDYFVADVNCDVVIRGTVGGKVYPASLLTQETVEAEMRNNPEKAQREYYNIFTQDGGVNQIVKRATIIRNSFVRPPVLFNDTGDRKFVFAYDPARNTDNSVLTVAELKKDPKKGYCLDIVNCVSFADLGIRRKTPMMYQDQIKELRKLLVDYNGHMVLDYDNIELLLADAGAGGGGNSWVRDSLIEDWKTDKGEEHRGLIDKTYVEGDVYSKRFPRAIDKLRLMEPSKYKAIMYEHLIQMLDADLITFPAEYDHKGYLSIVETDEKTLKKKRNEISAKLSADGVSGTELEEKVEEEMSKIDFSKTISCKLSLDEEVALSQIDALKEEVVNMCRVRRDTGKDSFKLAPHKDAELGGNLHDDRSYTLALLGHFLYEKRLEHIRKHKPKIDKNSILDKLFVTGGKPVSKFFG